MPARKPVESASSRRPRAQTRRRPPLSSLAGTAHGSTPRAPRRYVVFHAICVLRPAPQGAVGSGSCIGSHAAREAARHQRMVREFAPRMGRCRAVHLVPGVAHPTNDVLERQVTAGAIRPYARKRALLFAASRALGAPPVAHPNGADEGRARRPGHPAGIRRDAVARGMHAVASLLLRAQRTRYVVYPAASIPFHALGTARGPSSLQPPSLARLGRAARTQGVSYGFPYRGGTGDIGVLGGKGADRGGTECHTDTCVTVYP